LGVLLHEIYLPIPELVQSVGASLLYKRVQIWLKHLAVKMIAAGSVLQVRQSLGPRWTGFSKVFRKNSDQKPYQRDGLRP
jgi:hypothetical protein